MIALKEYHLLSIAQSAARSQTRTQPPACGQCRAALRPNARHCHHCGTKTATRSPRKLLRPAVLLLILCASLTLAAISNLRQSNARLDLQRSEAEARAAEAQATADQARHQLAIAAAQLAAAESKAQANASATRLLQAQHADVVTMRSQLTEIRKDVAAATELARRLSPAAIPTPYTEDPQKLP